MTRREIIHVRAECVRCVSESESECVDDRRIACTNACQNDNLLRPLRVVSRAGDPFETKDLIVRTENGRVFRV